MDCVGASDHLQKELVSKHFIKVKDILKTKQPNVPLFNNLDEAVKEIYNFKKEETNQEVNEIKNDNDQIEQALNSFKEEIIQEIDKLKQNIKNYIVQFDYYQNIHFHMKERVIKNFDLTNLQKVIQDLQKGRCQLQKANFEINNCFTSQKKINEEKQIIDTFNKIKPEFLNHQIDFSYDLLQYNKKAIFNIIIQMDKNALKKSKKLDKNIALKVSQDFDYFSLLMDSKTEKEKPSLVFGSGEGGGSLAIKEKATKVKHPCKQFFLNGKCSYGDKCKFSHEKKLIL